MLWGFIFTNKMEEQKKTINNSKGVGTMKVSNQQDKVIDYIIIKIGDKIYSTKFGENATENGCKGLTEDTETIRIGKEKCFMIRSIPLVETNKHKELDDPINGELDIYYKDE